MELLADLQQTLYQEIPITQQLQVAASAYDGQELRLQAPLAANINHKGTLFAGSLNAVTTLAGWSLVWLLLQEQGIHAEIVIQDSTIAYQHPVTQDFTAICLRPDSVLVERFIAQLTRYGRGRLALTVHITEQDRQAVVFQGRYVAYRIDLVSDSIIKK